jgi:hypothetical protein
MGGDALPVIVDAGIPLGLAKLLIGIIRAVAVCVAFFKNSRRCCSLTFMWKDLSSSI